MKVKWPLFWAGMACMAGIFLLLAAAAPMPILRNQWTTNTPNSSIIGDYSYSNAVAGSGTNFLVYTSQGIQSFAPGRSLWKAHGWYGDPKIFEYGPGSSMNSNGSAAITVVDAAVTPLQAQGATGQGVDYLQVKDSAANTIGYFRTNAMWQTTNDFYATVQTADATVTTIITLTMRDNASVQVGVRTAGFNATTSASYYRVAAFRSVAGTVTQIGPTTAVSTGEDNAAMDCTVSTTANTIIVQVTGIAATTINWKTYVSFFYGQ